MTETTGKLFAFSPTHELFDECGNSMGLYRLHRRSYYDSMTWIEDGAPVTADELQRWSWMAVKLCYTSCPDCGGVGLRETSRLALDAVCQKCGWYFTSTIARKVLRALSAES